MITKYKTNYSNDKIVKVEVVLETNQSVWIQPIGSSGMVLAERRLSKMSGDVCYLNTWQEAHELLIERAQQKVDMHRRHLEQAKGTLGNIKGMKQPQQ